MTPARVGLSYLWSDDRPPQLPIKSSWPGKRKRERRTHTSTFRTEYPVTRIITGSFVSPPLITTSSPRGLASGTWRQRRHGQRRMRRRGWWLRGWVAGGSSSGASGLLQGRPRSVKVLPDRRSWDRNHWMDLVSRGGEAKRGTRRREVSVMNAREADDIWRGWP